MQHKPRRLEHLERAIQRIERGMVAHNEVPGHPGFCSEAVVIVRTFDCMLGSDESGKNVYVDFPIQWRNGIPGGRAVLRALRRAVKWMEYDLMVAEASQLRAELAAESQTEEAGAEAAGASGQSDHRLEGT